MSVNLDAGILQLSGEPVSDPSGKPITIRSVCVDALMTNFSDERDLSGDDKIRRFNLAKRLHDGASDLTSEQITLLKQLTAKAYTTLVVGRVWEALDPASV